jgi:F-type H+-transporting ATPase subunit epsilon
MSDTLTLELVTPEKVALTKTASMVVLPAFEGEMGVLPGHEPFMVQLMPGEVRVMADKDSHHLAISGGFAEILNNKVSIFAETAEMAEEIDSERAKQALEKAKAARQQKDVDPLTLVQAEASVRRAEVRLKISQLRKKPKSAMPPR